MSELRLVPWQAGEELAVGSGQGTIRSVLGAAENPDKVVQKKGLRVFEEMETKDAHYASVLQTRKLSLLGKGWEIQPASEAPRDQEVADFVRWCLNHMRGSFLQDLLEILDAMGKGFSLLEIVYGLAARGPWQGKVVLQAIKAKDQQYFAFALDDFDNILPDGIVQNPLVSHGLRLANTLSEKTIQELQTRAGIGESVNRRLPREKFIHFAFNSRAENPYGRGLGSLCYWYSWFKTEGGFKFWLVFLEKYGSPTARLKVTQEAADPDREKVKSILRALQQETGVIVPEGMELDFLEATRAGDAGYQRLVETCNSEISKAVLGQTLTTEQGDRGARSLGEVHQDVRYDIMRFDADLLEVVINEQLVERLVDFNYAGVETYPQFAVPLKPRRDLAVFAQSLTQLVAIGARIPERYVHDELGIPTPEEDEEVLASRPTPGWGGQAGTPQEGAGSPVGAFAERPASRAQLEPVSRARAAREAQDLLIEAGAAQGRLVFGQLLEALIDQVRRAEAIARRRYDVALTVPDRPLKQLLLNHAVLAHLTGQLQATEEMAAKGVEFTPQQLRAFAEEDGTLDLLAGATVTVGAAAAAEAGGIVGPEEAIELFRRRLPITRKEFDQLKDALKHRYFTVAGIEDANLLKLVQQALIEAIETGGTYDDFARKVRERGVVYTGRAYGQDLAGQPLGDDHLRLIFRNNTMSAYNQGREAIFNHPDVAPFVWGYLYSATNDNRTRPAHKAMDGRIYRKDDPIWQRWTPPNGHNCRCHKVAITQDEAQRLREDQISTKPPVVDGEVVDPDEGFGGGA